MNLSSYKAHTLGKIMATLAEPYSERDIRERLGDLILDLFGAQYYASFVWDDGKAKFDRCVSIAMDMGNLARYESYYQFHDPITPALQRFGKAARVSQVMPQSELVKTEFFNDFLARDGLYWGLNVYAWTDNVNLGDMRIWRDRRRENFTQEDVHLLDLVRPAFTAALGRCRKDEHASQPSRVSTDTASDARQVLSAREYDVARLIAMGLPDKEVAIRLNISVTTVRTHIDHAFRKLGVDNRVLLARRLNP